MPRPGCPSGYGPSLRFHQVNKPLESARRFNSALSKANMSKYTRRHFLKKSALSAGAAYAVPHFAIGKAGQSANNTLNMAVIGAGGMGNPAVRLSAGENLVALCDVDQTRAARSFSAHPDARRFEDFRVMLDKMGREIDAVCIATPDHTHFPAAMAAMELGKHVFVQKPLAHNIWQVRTLRKAMHYYKVKTQMGNQGHFFDGMNRIREWVDAGVIGEVRKIDTWTDRPNAPFFYRQPAEAPMEQPIPETLNWDLWLGPAKKRPYSDVYVPTTWRGWWDFGCGSLGDIGCHTFDAPFWTLELGLPTRVEGECGEVTHPGYTPWGAKTTYHFPARGGKPPVELTWYENGFEVPKPEGWEGEFQPGEGGMVMYGAKNTLFHYGMRPTSPRLLPDSRMEEMKPALREIPRMPSTRGGPIKQWMRVIKGEENECGTNFDYAAPLSEMVLLGAIAQRVGKTIEYDAETMTITNIPGLDHLIKEPVREGWSYGENLWT